VRGFAWLELCELVRLRGEMAARWGSRVVKAVWHIGRRRDARGIFATIMYRYIAERFGEVEMGFENEAW